MAAPDDAELDELSRSDLLVLAVLGRAAEPQTVRQVARGAAVAGWRARVSLRGLRRRGLVVRDAGTRRFAITEEGSRRGGVAFATQVLADLDSTGALELVLPRWRGLGGLDDRSVLGPAYAVSRREGDVAGLAELAGTGNPDERALALRALGALRAPESVPALAGVLADATLDESIRADAALALGRVATGEATAVLRDALESGSSVLRAAVADALGAVADRSSREALVALSGYPSAPVRAAAVRALGRLDDPAVVPSLIPYLEDADAFVRREARRGLVVAGSPDAVRALRHNPWRTLPLRLLDAGMARAAIRHAGRRSAQPPVRVEPVRRQALAHGVRLLVVTAALLAGAIWLAGAHPLVVAAATTAVVLLLAALLRGPSSRPYDRIDQLHARLEAWPATARPVPAWSTVLTALGERPLLSAFLVLVPTGLDLVAGGTGIACASVAALCLSAVHRGLRERASLARYEAARGMRVWTEALPDPLPGRRFFGYS